ncbi:hypothetical protein [Thiomicrorhabdus sp. Milos-T2]|nr:hypothetical protein [Thiomicrorhabdus sp. Milos-T2]
MLVNIEPWTNDLIPIGMNGAGFLVLLKVKNSEVSRLYSRVF